MSLCWVNNFYEQICDHRYHQCTLTIISTIEIESLRYIHRFAFIALFGACVLMKISFIKGPVWVNVHVMIPRVSTNKQISKYEHMTPWHLNVHTCGSFKSTLGLIRISSELKLPYCESIADCRSFEHLDEINLISLILKLFGN